MANVYLKEITDWSESKCPVPNHTYIVRPDGHLAGYIKTGTKSTISKCCKEINCLKLCAHKTIYGIHNKVGVLKEEQKTQISQDT